MQVSYFFKKHGGLILSVLATGGIVGTAVEAVRATPKAMDIIKEQEPETKWETVKATYKCYIPAAGIGATTIATVWAAFALNKHNYKEVLGAYATLKLTSDNFQKKVKEYIGQEKFEEIRDLILKEDAEKAVKPKHWTRQKKEHYDWYYEPWSGQFFYTTEDTVQEAIHKLNGQIEAYRYASLNDLLDFLGLRRSVYGDELGWWSSDYDDSDNGGFYGVKLIECDFADTVIEGQECRLMKYTPVFVDAMYQEEPPELPEDFEVKPVKK